MTIPYGRQDIDDDDIQAVVEVLRSDWLTQGPAIERFEAAMAARCEARYAVAVSSATAGLHLACLAAELGPGDALWTSPNTFVASANCGLYCGADVDFVDIDPRTYALCPVALADKLAAAATPPKVVVPVHFAGQPCDMGAIAHLARESGFAIVEDASHALGGSYRGRPIGSCVDSAMTVLSFHPVKIITTGEGGMVLTNRPELYERLRALRSHGITRDPAAMQEATHGPWYYEQLALGYNYRMTDLQAALGTSQLRRLDAFIARRRELVARYDRALRHLPLVLPRQHPDGASAHHLYVIRLRLDQLAVTRRQVFEALRGADIGVNVHYIPVHTQPYYRALGFGPGDFPEAERYYAEAISLPLHAGLSDAEQDYVIGVLGRALEGATG